MIYIHWFVPNLSSVAQIIPKSVTQTWAVFRHQGNKMSNADITILKCSKLSCAIFEVLHCDWSPCEAGRMHWISDCKGFMELLIVAYSFDCKSCKSSHGKELAHVV